MILTDAEKIRILSDIPTGRYSTMAVGDGLDSFMKKIGLSEFTNPDYYRLSTRQMSMILSVLEMMELKINVGDEQMTEPIMICDTCGYRTKNSGLKCPFCGRPLTEYLRRRVVKG